MKASSDERQEPREVPFLISLLLVPLILLVGPLSGPAGRIMLAYRRRKERRFFHEMKLEGRLMEEQDFAAALENRKGSLIEEWSSVKHPVRSWWTEDDIPAIAPFRPGQNAFDALVIEENDHVPEFPDPSARGIKVEIPVVAVYKGYRARQRRNPSMDV